MKGYVPFRGKFIKVSNVPRGRPIVRTAEEWHQRALRLKDDAFWFKDLVITGLIAFTVWVGLDALLGTLDTFSWLDAAIYTFIFWAMTYAHETYHSNREVERVTYAGLFEHGLQFRWSGSSLFFFIPYGEIRSVGMGDGISGRVMEMDLHGFKKPLKFSELLEIIGEDGYAELQRRVGVGTRMPELPRLFVYGGPAPDTTGSPLLADAGPRSYDFSAPLRA